MGRQGSQGFMSVAEGARHCPRVMVGDQASKCVEEGLLSSFYGGHRAGQALASCWGPSPLTSLQHAAGGGDSCLSPAGEVAGALTVVCGMLDPEQGEESHFVGHRGGHVCIHEALNLEPLDLRLPPQGPGP